MQIAGRKLSKIAKAPFEKRHYTAAVNTFHRFPDALRVFNRFLFGIGTYPYVVPVITPAGQIQLTLYSHDDLLTVNECFCRFDYDCDPTDKVIVDFGSNIGISAAYFLTTSLQAFVYLFEPLPANIERLCKNLAPLEGRFALSEVAVGLKDGIVEFGWEDTGRYGGVGLKTGHYISVKCVDSNKILEGILEKHGHIDILKIDIEGLEEPVITRIPMQMARRIKKIYVEHNFKKNPLENTHSFNQYGPIAQFTNLNRTSASSALYKAEL